MMRAVTSFFLLGNLLSSAAAASTGASYPVQLETRSDLKSRLANVHVTFREPVEGAIHYIYGSCNLTTKRDDIDVYQVIGTGHHGLDRLVWVIPEEISSGGCITAWSEHNGGLLLGRSEPQNLQLRKRTLRKRGPYTIPMTNASGINAWGPWFDGVELLKSKNLSAIDAGAAKRKHVTIVGAGMAGLMTYLALTQAGFCNVEILEAGERLGGRIHTEYLTGGPFDYSYQEMGPMRFPYTYKSSVTNGTYNITDHQLVFQLAAEMNTINKHDKNFSVDFIPWYQSNPNGLYYHDGIKLSTGLPPTVAQVSANASLKVASVDDPSTAKLSEAISKLTGDDSFYIKVAKNMFEAHAAFLEDGLDGLPGDQWSEFAYMVNHLNATLNDTDIVSGGDYSSSFWDSIYEGVYFSAANWLTIDGGLNRLPLAFHPLVDKATTMNTNVERIQFDEKTEQVTIQWKHNYTDTLFQNKTTDFAVLAVPFSVLKKWRFSTGSLPTTITNAIGNVPYTSACKVALEFKTRFWEHLANPIYGSCSTSTDIPGIGSICYPSYNMNGTGPATMLGSYISGGQWGDYWSSKTEEEHMQYVLEAMAEIHGQDLVFDQFTGKYNRRCWLLDPLQSGSWASPEVGQHALYLPEYFKTHSNMIFVGEHTSYTHAWIASALESGIRGSVQLMLELGLVDEAKTTTEKWMARWIEV